MVSHGIAYIVDVHSLGVATKNSMIWVGTDVVVNARTQKGRRVLSLFVQTISSML